MDSNIQEINYKTPRNFVFLLLFGTVFFITIRILVVNFDLIYLIEGSKDYDFRNLIGMNQNGLENFPPYYLYFWYFIFYPFAIIDPFISMLIWDILRFFITAYVAYKLYFKLTFRIDQKIIYTLISFGFINDGWYNNCNFVIMLFLYLSYKYLEEDKKWASGLFFALATFKINALAFLPVLLIMKKIKFKDLFYYLVPLCILLLPYIIFPDYTLSLISNWSSTSSESGGITPVDSFFMKIAQPSQFLYFCIMVVIILQGIIKYKKHAQIRLILLGIFGLFYLYIIISVWLYPLFTYYMWLSG